MLRPNQRVKQVWSGSHRPAAALFPAQVGRRPPRPALPFWPGAYASPQKTQRTTRHDEPERLLTVRSLPSRQTSRAAPGTISDGTFGQTFDAARLSGVAPAKHKTRQIGADHCGNHAVILTSAKDRANRQSPLHRPRAVPSGPAGPNMHSIPQDTGRRPDKSDTVLRRRHSQNAM